MGDIRIHLQRSKITVIIGAREGKERPTTTKGVLTLTHLDTHTH